MGLKGDKISIEMAEIKNIILDKRYRIIKGLKMRTCEGKRNNQCFAQTGTQRTGRRVQNTLGMEDKVQVVGLTSQVKSILIECIQQD